MTSRLPWALVIGASVVVVIAGLRSGVTLLIPLILSAFLATVLYPSVAWLVARRVPSGIAVLLTTLLVLSAFSGPGFIVQQAAQTFVASAPTYRADIERGLLPWLERLGLSEANREGWLSLVDPGAAFDLVRTLSSGAASLLGNTFIVMLTTAFILLEANNFRQRIAAALRLSPAQVSGAEQALAAVHHYLLIKALVSLATGLVVWLWLLWVGVDFPVLWGLLAFILNFIPNFGSLLAAVPPALLALARSGPTDMLAVIIGFAVVNVILGSILEPRIMGRRLGLSPLAVLLSLLFWGWVWGSVGLLLAVPLTMVVKIVLEHSDVPWLALLLGGPIADTAGAPSEATSDHS
ncbi:MAG: AI-2E family transporter [Acidobacteria bacterium]|nr:AI-2E family transporter [Acidobacteriota bacterium]